MFKRIVVTLDGSKGAEQALATAAGIARRTGASLTLLHALDYHCVDYATDVPSFEFFGDGGEDCARRYVQRVAARVLNEWKVAADALVIPGDAVPILLEHYRTEADLAVMTTHGRGPFKRMWLGSVADRVVRESPIPTLLIHTSDDAHAVRDDGPFHHALVPLDGSALAERILPAVGELARSEGARVTLLRLVEFGLVPAFPGAVDYAARSAVGAAEDTLSGQQQYLEEVGVRLPIDHAVVALPVVYSVGAEILDYASENHADLIALSTHGSSGFRRFVLGSVADKVIRGAHVPVLVYRPEQIE